MIDRDPEIRTPLSLVPDGFGPSFERGPFLILTSSTVTRNGDVYRRDYKLNGHAATKTHREVVNDLDGELKIRSRQSKKGSAEFKFFAKAFHVKDGDQIDGYLSLNGVEDPDEAKKFRVIDGKVLPTKA
jgi:hypothetical protein